MTLSLNIHQAQDTTVAFLINQFVNPVNCNKLLHGQASANWTKPGPSFQLLKWPFERCTILVLSIKLTNLKLKTWPKQLLGYLSLVIALPGSVQFIS